jgi:iron complex transport system substrate-binding protein
VCTRVLRGLVAATVVLSGLTACATGPSGSTALATSSSAATGAATDAFPVTVKHAFGSTTLQRRPERIATVSWVNADVALALGVVPVGMPADEWGGNAKKSTPWKDAALKEAGAAIGSPKAPAQYLETDGPDYAAIAQTTPDVILAAYSGLTKEQYDKLTQIAPVVAYPDLAYGTSWQEATTMIGAALGRSDQAEQLVESTERKIAARVAKYPQLAGKTFIYGNLQAGKPVSVYTAQDNRSRFLSLVGMKLAPVVADRTADAKAFFVDWSAERADELASDVFVSWVPDAATARAVRRDPLIGRIPAVRRGALVTDSDNTLTLAISASSPLSLPWALDAVLPRLAAAADAA